MSQDLRQVGGYNIEGMIGSGATSLVYRATKGGVKYALKLMRPDRPAGDKKTFRAEAAALARIAHPTVLQIVEAGEQDGRPYLVSPFNEN